MFKKIIFIAIILFNFFIPVLVSAEVVGANSDIPALNPFCWKKKDCVAARRNFVEGSPTDEELAKNGFISNASTAPCNTGEGDQQWGRCLPAGVAKTEIDFGGRSSFSNIGDFILLMYKWLVTVASILAVIMIIVSGVQWITSGGNSEAISSAKSRIGGAIIGLFIAFMSYFILNTINPNLVNFRLPQVWLVRPQNLIPEFCADVPNEGKKLQFAYVSDIGKENDPLPPSNQLQYTTMKEKDMTCGKGFLVENGGEMRCFGHYCPPSGNKKTVCVKGENYSCEEGDLVIKLFLRGGNIGDQLGAAAANIPIAGALFSKTLKEDWLTNDVRVRAVCKSIDGNLYLARIHNTAQAVDSLRGADWGTKIKKIPTKVEGNYSYTYVFSGLLDNDAYDIFDCNTDKYTHIMGSPLAQPTNIVGYFIRYEVRPDQSWVSSHATRLKAAGIGAAVGWAIPIPGVGAGVGAATGYVVGWLLEDGPPEPNLNIGYENGNAIFGLYASPALREAKSQYENLAAIKSLGSYIPVNKLLNPKGLRLEVSFDINTLAKILYYKGSVPHNDDEIFW